MKLLCKFLLFVTLLSVAYCASADKKETKPLPKVPAIEKSIPKDDDKDPGSVIGAFVPECK